MAAARADEVNRAAVLRARGNGANPPALVCRYRSPVRERSLFPLRREQPRKPAVSPRLSGNHRTGAQVADAEPRVGRWLCRLRADGNPGGGARLAPENAGARLAAAAIRA